MVVVVLALVVPGMWYAASPRSIFTSGKWSERSGDTFAASAFGGGGRHFSRSVIFGTLAALPRGSGQRFASSACQRFLASSISLQ